MFVRVSKSEPLYVKIWYTTAFAKQIFCLPALSKTCRVTGKKYSLNMEKLEELMEMDTDIRKAEQRLEYLSSDAKTIEIYKAREKSLHERANMISSAKEEGKIEGKIEAAKNMLQRGMEANIVAEVTELTTDEIEKIIKQIDSISH